MEHSSVFKNRQFLLYTTGWFVSWTGTWMQNTALVWYVYVKTHSMGHAAMLIAIPHIVGAALNIFGGIITDSFDRRKILYFTSSVGAIQAFAISGATALSDVSFGVLVLLNFILGLSNGLESPTRHSMVFDLIPRNLYRQAGSFNAALVTASQAFAGCIIGATYNALGPSWIFFLNALSFLPVIYILSKLTVKHEVGKQKEAFKEALISGLRYVISNGNICFCLIACMVVTLFGFTYQGILPAVGHQMYGVTTEQGARILGSLTFSTALGCVAGSMTATKICDHAPFVKTVAAGSLVGGAGMLLLTQANLTGAHACLFVAGYGFTLAAATTRGEFQHITRSEMRGRVNGYSMTLFLGAMGVGKWGAGVMADRFGCKTAFTFCGIALVATAIALLLVGPYFNFGDKQQVTPQ